MLPGSAERGQLFLSPNTVVIATFCVVATSLALFSASKQRHKSSQRDEGIPNATESKYIIGHALAYKNNPASFLLRQSKIVGSIFRINLAGRRMIVLCGGASDVEMDLVRKATTLPERTLSARDAVSDIGFEYTLGKANVYDGTDFHKRLIKDYLNRGEDTVPRLVSALQEAYKVEIDGAKSNGERIIIKDFLGLVRRCTIRAVLDVFLGNAFLRPHKDDNKEGEDKFIDDFIVLQDDIEEATAAAAVLPRWLSLRMILRPVEQSRLKLQKYIAKRILDGWCAPIEEQGPWLKEFRNRGISLDRASEYVVGLLFAAHKNPAIGSTQSYLYLRLEGSKQEHAEVESEARIFLKSPSVETLEKQCHYLRRCCLETLRLTSHALGAIRTAREEISLGKCPILVASHVSTEGGNDGDSSQNIILCPNDVVAISHIVPSLSKEMWGDDADTYNSSRKEWTDKGSYPSELKFSAFSNGLHRCPGQKVALYIMQINVSILCALYDIEFVGHVPDVSYERATLAQRDGNVCISVSKKTP